MSSPISVLVPREGPRAAIHETLQRALSTDELRKNVANTLAKRTQLLDGKPSQATSNLPANAKSTGKAMIGGQL
jgi:hypothetical protein